MHRVFLKIALVVLGFAAPPVWGQNVTLQLPTFQVFSVATTVVVPDRGSVYLGGVNRAAYGSTTRGVPGLSLVPGVGRLFTNRGIGSEVSSSGAHVTATILDLEELDRAVLAEAAAKRGLASGGGAGGGGTNPEVERKAAFISKHLAKHDPSRFKGNAPPIAKPAKQ